VSRVGNEDQFFFWRLHPVEIRDGVHRRGNEVTLSLNDKEGRLDPAGRRGQVGLDLIGHGLFSAKPEAILEIFEVLRVRGPQARRVGPQ